jgi:hypothetical protein
MLCGQTRFSLLRNKNSYLIFVYETSLIFLDPWMSFSASRAVFSIRGMERKKEAGFIDSERNYYFE